MSWAVGLLWAIPLLLLVRLLRRQPDVATYPPVDGIPVSVIIPARNEADNIANVVASVLASNYQSLELLVVDDRSTDDTADILANFTDTRLKVISGEQLPDGWFGKPWACSLGAAAATGRILVFTDADTTHHPDLIGHTVSALQSESIDLLTLTSQQISGSFWERIVMPQVWAMLGLRYSPASVSNATRPHQVVANGQFIAVTRESYDELGGHGAVHDQVVEDLALAQHYFRHGKRLRMMHGESLLATRMYRSLPAMIEGWSKNLHVGARQSLSGLPLPSWAGPVGVMLGFSFWLVPLVLLPLGVLSGAMGLAIALSATFWAAMLWGMKIPVIYTLGYPLGAAVALGITVRSALRGRQRIEWRGRTYSTSGTDSHHPA